MSVVNKCDVCGTVFEEGSCPSCKAMKHSKSMNDKAVERVKKEIISQEEAKRIEEAFFEDDAEIKLRDGKTYKIPPCTLKNARRLMQLLKTVNIDVIMLNFVPTDDPKADAQREADLFEILMMAFTNYKDITREYVEEYVDVGIAEKIISILIGLNGLKK